MKRNPGWWWEMQTYLPRCVSSIEVEADLAVEMGLAEGSRSWLQLHQPRKACRLQTASCGCFIVNSNTHKIMLCPNTPWISAVIITLMSGPLPSAPAGQYPTLPFWVLHQPDNHIISCPLNFYSKNETSTGDSPPGLTLTLPFTDLSALQKR